MPTEFRFCRLIVVSYLYFISLRTNKYIQELLSFMESNPLNLQIAQKQTYYSILKKRDQKMLKDNYFICNLLMANLQEEFFNFLPLVIHWTVIMLFVALKL